MLIGAVALKENELQFISNQSGDVPSDNPGNFGLYLRDTRFLNRFELTINGAQPLYLSHSALKQYIATFQFINPALRLPDGRRVQQQTISIRRSRFVTSKGMYERIGFQNCNRFAVDLDLVLAFDADFRDMFAVRGFKTQQVAGQITASFGGGSLSFVYRGRDALTRRTDVMFSRSPEAISSREVRFHVHLEPQQIDTIVVRVQPTIGRSSRVKLSPDFDGQLERLAASYRKWDESSTRVITNNELFDGEMLRASRYDVRALLEMTPHGVVPDAGVPWYAVPFGRDALFTAFQTLIYNPSIAEGTLRYLAAHQGTQIDPYREEQPGKILHEMRHGELARLKEVPHTPYFGTIDATPLFLILFVETMKWLDSVKLYNDLLAPALRALDWIDEYGDIDGDGYVEYMAQGPGGVINQGWKDSKDSVQYEDGTNATPPIALVEVQAYVYGAKTYMAALLRQHGDRTRADKLEAEAEELKTRFNRDFWMPEEEFYALALDGEKRQVKSVTSNPGHCLWTGICDPAKARLVARRLLEPDMFSGWGIRTLSSKSPNYNPMSYHNGSVWPHDTALIALALRKIGCEQESLRLVTALIDAALRFQDGRLPELFCGFERDRRFNSNPTAYVVSCSPQAWAAGCGFMLLQTMLGAAPEAGASVLRVSPMLPEMFRRVSVERLKIGREVVSLRVDREGDGFRCEMQGSHRLALEVVPA